jgi:hypothetical protein
MKAARRPELLGRILAFQAAVTHNEVQYHGRAHLMALVVALATSITVFCYVRPLAGDAIADVALGAIFFVCFLCARVVYRS